MLAKSGDSGLRSQDSSLKAKPRLHEATGFEAPDLGLDTLKAIKAKE